MLRLSIDTSILNAQIAISNDSKSLSEYFSKDRNNSMELSHIVSTVLTNNKLKLSDIDECIVSIGPGSFTGIRSGLAWINGVICAQPTNINFYPVSSLEVLTNNICLENALNNCITILANTKKIAYVHYLSIKDNCSEFSYFNENELNAFIKTKKSDKIIVDKNWEPYLNITNEFKNVQLLERYNIAKKAINSLQKISNKELQHFKRKMQPLYLRASSAEEKATKIGQ